MIAHGAEIARNLRFLFADDIAVAVVDPRMSHPEILPSETPAIAGAVDRRRREFIAGRVAARRAMAERGLEGQPVPSGADRAPIWPAGIVGSISHTATCCVAVAGCSDSYSAIGVDIEPDEPLERDLWESILLPGEQGRLTTDAAGARLARLIFSAKECAYKCQYPLTGVLFGFDTLSIELAPLAFRAIFQRGIGPFREGDGLEGRYRVAAGLIMTGMAPRRRA